MAYDKHLRFIGHHASAIPIGAEVWQDQQALQNDAVVRINGSW